MKSSASRIRPAVFLAALCLTALVASPRAETALVVTGGTLGAGGQVVTSVAPKWNVRLAGNYFSYSRAETYSDVNYDGKLQLETGMALVDWFPWTNGFHVTAGGVLNGTNVKLTGKPIFGTYIINGRTYTTTEVSTLSAKADFRQAAPYAGIGFGNPLGASHHFSVIFDIGALFEGRPNINYTTTGTATGTAGLASDINAEKAKAYRQIKNYLNVYPVISLGVSYKF